MLIHGRAPLGTVRLTMIMIYVAKANTNAN
jgi:hypothetical protein